MSEYLTAKQASELMNVSTKTLKQWREARDPNKPSWCVVNKSVNYIKSEIREWLLKQPNEEQV